MRVTDNTHTYTRLRRAVQRAATAAREFATAAAVTPRPGLASAASARPSGGPDAVHLARQWYDGPRLAEPSPRRAARPTQQPGPKPGRRGPRL
jgi:hypothetical protein